MTQHTKQYAPTNGRATSAGPPYAVPCHVSQSRLLYKDSTYKTFEKPISGRLHLYWLNKFSAVYQESFISWNFSDSNRQKNFEEICHFLSAVTIWYNMIYIIILGWKPRNRDRAKQKDKIEKKKLQNKDRKSDGECVSVCVCMCVWGIFPELVVCADRDIHTQFHATDRLL